MTNLTDYTEKIARPLNLRPIQVKNTLQLVQEGATVPFISRYRKELTGGLDEVQIIAIVQAHSKMLELDQRRDSVLNSIEGQGMLTPELRKQIEQAETLAVLEDIYLPYKPKKRTLATIARENGLEPLALKLLMQQTFEVHKEAEKYLSDNCTTAESALEGARQIIAELVNEDVKTRAVLRHKFETDARLHSVVVKSKKEEAAKFADYFDWNEPLKKCPSHRLLAMLRGEKEGFLKVGAAPPDEECILLTERQHVRARTEAADQVKLACTDAYKRLLKPSLENEILSIAKERADAEAIEVFAENLRQLLLASPVGNLPTLAIDPGFKSGCKVACLSETGDFMESEVLYPHPPRMLTELSERILLQLIQKYDIKVIAIGNGTASRETEQFVRHCRLPQGIEIFMADESGASIYSASEIAREEFPELDVTERGTISIGRRVMDPLAELVKIDPKSIGVGQYQHDVNQKHLKESLDRVIVSCVNLVGVNLNTASPHLLSYVSGLNEGVARQIITYRQEIGKFSSRNELKKVKRLGAKTFEQCAGFLRIPEGNNPLDNSAVHPESYRIVERMAKSIGCKLNELVENNELISKINPELFVDEQAGLPTIIDIISELKKPGRDPRQKAEAFHFDESISTLDDLQLGMVVPGIVTNVTKFGAFVDIGVKTEGLVHISNLANKFVKNPADHVKLKQHVMVKIVGLDVARKRIELSMKDL